LTKVRKQARKHNYIIVLPTASFATDATTAVTAKHRVITLSSCSKSKILLFTYDINFF